MRRREKNLTVEIAQNCGNTNRGKLHYSNKFINSFIKTKKAKGLPTTGAAPLVAKKHSGDCTKLWQHKPRQLHYSKQFARKKEKGLYSGVHPWVSTLIQSSFQKKEGKKKPLPLVWLNGGGVQSTQRSANHPFSHPKYLPSFFFCWSINRKLWIICFPPLSPLFFGPQWLFSLVNNKKKNLPWTAAHRKDHRLEQFGHYLEACSIVEFIFGCLH